MMRAKSKIGLVWWIVLAVFTLISLWPIWSERFPPLQDYPEHLLHAQMLLHRNDPHFGYEHDFEFHLTLVYAAFFGVTGLFAKFLPIEVAGKMALSLYIALVAVLVMRLARRSGANVPPWGALLFFPFAFNQQWFQGNINYCYSLPLLLLTLLDADDLARHPTTPWTLTRHILLQLVLFFTHPLTFLVYLGLASTAAILSLQDRNRFKRGLVPPMTGLGLLVAWAIVTKSAGSSALFGKEGIDFVWQPMDRTAAFWASMFTGMRWNNGVDLLPIILWVAVSVAAFGAWVTHRDRQGTNFPYTDPLFLGLTLTGVFLLPFSVNDSSHPDVQLVSYFSWRLAAISYLFLALLVAQVRLRGRWALAFVVCVLGLLVLSTRKQQRVSREIRSIENIVYKIPPNSRILPLVFSRNSPELDPGYFDVHLHVHNYYHLLVGGGLSPYFFKAPLHPVHLRPEVNLPAPGEYDPEQFCWDLHADHYEFFLVRGAPPSFVAYLGEYTDLVVKSGEWLLLRRKHS